MGSGDVHSRFWLLMKSIFVRCWPFISTHWSDATISLAARRELLPREDKISGWGDFSTLVDILIIFPMSKVRFFTSWNDWTYCSFSMMLFRLRGMGELGVEQFNFWLFIMWLLKLRLWALFFVVKLINASESNMGSSWFSSRYSLPNVSTSSAIFGTLTLMENLLSYSLSKFASMICFLVTYYRLRVYC